MEIIKRNSGATIYINGVVKIGGEVVGRQGRKMMASPDAYVRVLDCWYDGYVMDRLHTEGVYTHDGAVNALAILERFIWKTMCRTTSSTEQQLKDYYSYVRKLEAPEVFKKYIEARMHEVVLLWNFGELHRVEDIHGDATLENLGFINDTPYWFDPSVRKAPLVAEMDAGKLLQSLYGYHGELSDDVQDVTSAFISDRLSMPASLFFFVTHLIRLWALQPQRQDWAMAAFKRMELI
jgi:hypothetical protein